MNNRLSVKSRKYLIIISFGIVFFATLILNIPAWVLSSQLSKYSNGSLALYNLTGSFWNGSGLLVASSKKNQFDEAPLAYLQWKISPGLTKYINIQFTMAQHKVANVYLNNNGVNVDKLDLSLSVIQVSHLSDVVKDLNISGNFQVNAEHILIGKKSTGLININIKNVSSGISPVNPLGSYNVIYNIVGNKIDVQTQNDAVLSLSGSGSLNGLILKASISPEKAVQMKTFITLLGMPNADGTFNLKLF